MEITSVAEQEVLAGRNILFNETVVPGSKCIVHRGEGSGLISLRGLTKNQCKARFLVIFNGNIALPTTGTAQEISVALTISGEPLESSLAAVTPANAEEYFNVTSFAYIDVPTCTNYVISVQNTSGVAIDVRNANLAITRVA